MPNTLVHIAIQAPLTRVAIARGEFFTLSLLGCVIPDVPWVIQRITRVFPLPIDLYDLRAYATVQATLFFSFFLGATLAAFFRRPIVAVLTIAAGCLVHFMLDAVETKWGNGVHFFAPFDWGQLNWRMIWPDDPIIQALTFVGIAVFAATAVRTRPFSAGLVWERKRIIALLTGIAIYLLAPFLFLQSPYSADNHYLATLADRASRTGKFVEFDRVRVARTGDAWQAFTYVGEPLSLQSFNAKDSGTYSLKAKFLSPDRLRVTAWHLHKGGRDIASVTGVALIALWLILAAGGAVRQRGALIRTGSQSDTG